MWRLEWAVKWSATCMQRSKCHVLVTVGLTESERGVFTNILARGKHFKTKLKSPGREKGVRGVSVQLETHRNVARPSALLENVKISRFPSTDAVYKHQPQPRGVKPRWELLQCPQIHWWKVAKWLLQWYPHTDENKTFLTSLCPCILLFCLCIPNMSRSGCHINNCNIFNGYMLSSLL